MFSFVDGAILWTGMLSRDRFLHSSDGTTLLILYVLFFLLYILPGAIFLFAADLHILTTMPHVFCMTLLYVAGAVMRRGLPVVVLLFKSSSLSLCVTNVERAYSSTRSGSSSSTPCAGNLRRNGYVEHCPQRSFMGLAFSTRIFLFVLSGG